MPRILLVDDHAVVRQGLKQILHDQLPNATFGEAQDSAELFDRLRNAIWDIVLLDVRFPDANGLELLPELKKRSPKTPIVMLSMYHEAQYVVRAMKLGAAGYLTKDSAPEELVAAVKKALSGGKYVSPRLAGELASYAGQIAEQAPHHALSPREFQVLCLVASGKTLTEIALRLSLSVKTVSTYRTRILEKMRLRTSAELTYYAVKNGLVM